MKVESWALAAFFPLLSACTEYQTGTSDTSGGFIQNLPEGVVAIAAPYQDLNAVTIDPSDGCYVYRYVGPVETTYLPLRTSAGNPICTRQPVTAISG